MSTIASQIPRLDGYAKLLRIARSLAAARQPQELRRLLHRHATSLFDASGVCVSVVDGDGQRARVAFCADGSATLPEGASYPLAESLAMHRGEATLHPKDEFDAGFVAAGLPPDGRACMAAPLFRDTTLLGSVAVLAAPGAGFDALGLELLGALADMAAVALDNAHFYEELDHQRAQAERLEEIGRAITSSLELDEVLEKVTEAARELLGADGSTVWLAEGDKQARAARSIGEMNTAGSAPVVLPPALVEILGRRREPVFFDRSDPAFLTEELREVTVASSILAVPLVADDRVYGALTVGQEDTRRFTTADVRLLQRLADQAAVAVNNASLHERLRSLSLTDPLTGLPNRRHVELFLKKEFAAAQRGRRLTLLMFDLDHFKSYNDAEGHQAGDEVLKAFARILIQQTRSMNLVGRWGGDEFLSIVADTDRDGAFIHAGRIAQRVDQDPLLAGNGVSFSVGIATYTPEFSTPEELLHAADVDLYEVKHTRVREIRD